MDSNDVMLVGMLALAALSAGVVVYLLLSPYLSGELRTDKRIQAATENRVRRTALKQQVEVANSRRRQVADTLKELEDRQKQREKVSLRLRLERAGLDIEPRVFWIASVISGVVVGAIIWAMAPGLPIIVPLLGAFVGTLGLPRWLLARLTKRRQYKFTDEFANSIDVIVRGVKSGLPLVECLNIIARESPQPIAGEFTELVEQQRVGVPLAEAFDRMMVRMPLPEVRFFAIVLAIQQQAGGNLSEALGNLSGVLRDRKRLQAKVRALSAEAKASAMVLGALPFVVMALVYISTPSYIALLWSTKFGQFLLAAAGFWMTCGVLVMRKMINFKY
ncbi:MAG: type II secretion system F family protein [Hyphomonadaceae bacterium]|nr:type II secretion system F family protein [Hyphomonadaceae bacterium]